MVFIPYKVDLNLHRFPILTVLISIACIAVFVQQQSSAQALEKSIVNFCQGQQSDSQFGLTLEKIQGENSPGTCAQLIYAIFSSDDAKQEITALAEDAKKIDGFPADYSRQYVE